MAPFIKKNMAARVGMALTAAILSLSAAASAGAQSIPSYASYSDLSLGARGTQVSDLQGLLSEAGYLSIGLPTGYFGPLTQSALAAFQRSLGVSESGFGSLTRAALAGYVAKASIGSQTVATADTTSTSGVSNSANTGNAISMSLVVPLRSTGYWYQGNWYNSIPTPGNPDIVGYWVNSVWTAMPNVSASVANANVVNGQGYWYNGVWYPTSTANIGGNGSSDTNTIIFGTASASTSNDMIGISKSNWDPNKANPRSSVTCSLNNQNVYICQ